MKPHIDKRVITFLTATLSPCLPFLLIFFPRIFSCHETIQFLEWVGIIILLLITLFCYLWLISQFFQTNDSTVHKVFKAIIYTLFAITVVYGSLFAGAVGVMSYCHNEKQAEAFKGEL